MSKTPKELYEDSMTTSAILSAVLRECDARRPDHGIYEEALRLLAQYNRCTLLSQAALLPLTEEINHLAWHEVHSALILRVGAEFVHDLREDLLASAKYYDINTTSSALAENEVHIATTAEPSVLRRTVDSLTAVATACIYIAYWEGIPGGADNGL